MKRTLLTAFVAFASLFASSVVNAQTQWTAPAPPGSTLVSSTTDSVYLYNIGAGQFLCGGTTWGTHGALNNEGLPIRLTVDATETDWTIYFWSGSKSQQLFGRESTSDTYIDYNGQSGWCTAFNFAHMGENVYRIQCNDTPELYVGQVPTRPDYDKNGSEISQGVGIWADVSIEEDDAHVDWLIVKIGDYTAWKAINGEKQNLLALINQAEEEGIEVKQSIIDVLFNENATAEDVAKAKSEVKQQMVEELGKEASEENPVDFTNIFVVNPDFDNKSTTGWTLTGSYAKTQDNGPYYIQEDDGTGTWVNTEEIAFDNGGWLEFWKSGGIDQFQDAHQVISDLPVGQYRLQLAAVGKGGKLYAYTGGVRQEQEFTEHRVYVSFDFMHVGGDLKMGMDFTPASSGNPSWVAVDQFRLYYLGKGSEDPSLTMLRKGVETLEAYLEEDESHYYSTALRDSVRGIYDTANGLVEAGSEDSEANTAALNSVNGVIAIADAEIAAYKEFYTFINTTLPAAIDKYSAIEGSQAYEKLVEDLEGMQETLGSAYEQCTYRTADIEATFATYDKMIADANVARKAEVKKAWEDAAAAGQPLETPLNISLMFDNITYPLAALSHDSLTARGWTSNASAYISRSYTAEVWGTTFEVSRTLADLPRGKYTIKTKAFFREAENQTNYNTYIAGEGQDLAFVFAGAQQSAIINNAALVTTEARYSDDATITNAESETLYVTNSMEGAYTLFTGEDAAQTEVSVSSSVIANGGDITFGVRGIEGLADNCWVIWGDFEVYYEGVSATALDDEIAALIEKASAMDCHGVIAAENNIGKACEQGEAAYDSKEESVKTAAIKALQDAIDYATESGKLVEQLYTTATTYTTKMESLDPERTYTGEAYPQLLDDVNNAIGEETFQDNEQISKWISDLEAGWVPYLMTYDQLANATEDNPIDVTEVFVNADFEITASNYNAPEGWTLELEKQTGNVVSNQGGYECWNTGTFAIYQEFTGLKDGYYELAADGFYRIGSSDDAVNAYVADTAAVNAYLYAGEAQAELYNWLDMTQVALDEETGTALSGLAKTAGTIPFWAPNNGTSAQAYFADGRYTNNTLVFHADATSIKLGITKPSVSYSNDWVYFDNFKLSYLGTTAPTGIENCNVTENAEATTRIYTLDGMQTNGLQRGINIVQTISNGKVIVKKILK